MPDPAPLTLTQADPKNLIRESFRIEGIGAPECRSIFVDWALSLPDHVAPVSAIRLLLDHYAPQAAPGAQAHPMVAVLVEGAQSGASVARRRGGRAARLAR
ncbi:hypothetical protein [Paracoccus stylophorae]|uniref:hypothetical protein n=1 Tax=Paracoccus stylophorae TaxID=659350 RepID=UPI00235065FC|nr:hypothetical protein [Paracoccus stylophorae]